MASDIIKSQNLKIKRVDLSKGKKIDPRKLLMPAKQEFDSNDEIIDVEVIEVKTKKVSSIEPLKLLPAGADNNEEILNKLQETNKNLLSINELIAGLNFALQKSIIDDKKRLFKERDRQRKTFRKQSFGPKIRGPKIKTPQIKTPKIGGGILDFFLYSILAGLVEFIPKIIEFIENIPYKIGETIASIQKAIEKSIGDIKTNIENFFGNIKTNIENAFSEFYTNVDNFTGGNLTKLLNGLKEVGSFISEQASNLYNMIDEFTGGKLSEAKNFIGNKIINPIKDFFSEKFTWLGTEITKLFDNVKSKFLSFVPEQIKQGYQDKMGPQGIQGGETLSKPSISGGERDYLKRLMIAEAGGEGEVGMAAVGRSVMNRASLIQSGKVGAGTFNAKSGSITDVINAPSQYQPVREGKLTRELTPEEDARAERALQMAENQEKFTAGLKSKGITSEGDIKKLSASTGFRTGSAKKDASQNVNTTRLGGHIFNTAGNQDMLVGGNVRFDNSKHGTPAGIKADPGFNAGKGDKSKRIFLHWTAHDHNTPFNNYHTTFLGDGKAVRNTANYGVHKGTHTGGANNNSVGLAIAAAGGAQEGRTLGKYPPTGAQLNAMALEAARLAVAWGWDASTIDKNVMTHGEWERKATSSGILPGRPQRWDLDQLFSPSEKIGSGKSDGGNYMRNLIKQYFNQLKSGERTQPSPTPRPAAVQTARQILDTVDRTDTQQLAGATRRITPEERVVPGAGESIVVTSRRGTRWGKMHQGTDIAAPVGTPLYAFTDGVITDVGYEGGYGKFVAWKDTYGKEHFYAHLSNNSIVSKGQKVKAGKVIGKSGNTGRGTGPHLHWEYGPEGQTGRNGAGLTDPLNYFDYLMPFGSKTLRSGKSEEPIDSTPSPQTTPTTTLPVSPDLDKVTRSAETISRPSGRRGTNITSMDLPTKADQQMPLPLSEDPGMLNNLPFVNTSFYDDVYKVHTRSLLNIVG